ncbi:MAG: TrkA C-terminal domain-containing protein, partial [Vicinamibacteria bacterium]
DDEVNAEACRVALGAANPPTVIGVARRPDRRATLEEIGAEVVVRPDAVAALIKNRIERTRKVASGVGLGQGEILEIPVLKSSPAVDARVQDLRARRWIVAAIYRKDRYVVPHGHVVLREGDRLLLTGEPDILPHVADYLRAGVARFPLQYGVRIVALPLGERDPSFWREVEYLAGTTRSRALLVLAPKGAAVPEMQVGRGKVETRELNSTDSLLTVLKRELSGLDCGCLVLPKERSSFWHRIGLAHPPFVDGLDLIASPVLLAAGSHPYRRILLPILDPDASILAAELAIDLARQLEVPIASVVLSAPPFIVGKETLDDQREAVKAVMEIASMYHMKIDAIAKEGNPPKEMAEIAGEGDLVVIGAKAGRKASFFRPDTALQMVYRCRSSVLLLSHRERIHGTG